MLYKTDIERYYLSQMLGEKKMPKRKNIAEKLLTQIVPMVIILDEFCVSEPHIYQPKF